MRSLPGSWAAAEHRTGKKSKSRRAFSSSSTHSGCAVISSPSSIRSGSSGLPVKDLDPGGYGLTLWDLDREFFTNGALGKEKATLREIIDVMRETYCNTVTSEYMFIAAPGQKEWLQNKQETTRNKTELSAVEKKRVMEKLAEAEAFERHLHTKYVGHKRFSLEGLESTIPLLDELLSLAAKAGVADAVLGMAHRGRLNVLANVLEKPLPQIFAEFEGSTDPDETQGSGDVKYHLGAQSTHKAPGRFFAGPRTRSQSFASRVREPGRRRHDPREAGPAGRSRACDRAAHSASRRRGVRGPGCGRRDAEPLRA